ncbi:MAG: hypothetical protein ABI216_22065 [Devosia sp.]
MKRAPNDSVASITKDLSVEAYDRICRDIRNQPKWRLDSDTDADYYDGAQTSVDVNQRLKEAGIPPQDSNLIKPTINAVLGIEARSRTDYKVTSDDESQSDLAEGLSARLKEIETESRADRAMSDAYSSMMRTGIGWIEVSREYNPLKYPYRVREVHRNTMFWDWTAREPDLSDARYIRRDDWMDKEQAIVAFPEQMELIDNSWNGWNTVDVYDGDNTGMARAYEAAQTWSQSSEDYLNHAAGMVKLSELWYRYYESAPMMYLPDGNAIEYNKANPYHQQAVAQGLVQVQKAMVPRIRVSIWLGPHKLMDVPTPLPHNDFPYIPFWCFRKDRARTPYGMIRDMRGPQDQIIDLDILLYEVLNSKSATLDNDALDLSANTLQEFSENMQSLRSVTVLNSLRRNADGLKVTREYELAGQLFQIIGERKRRIEEVGGIYRAMLGDSKGANSGVMVDSLVEQGSTVLAEPNDNFRYARRLCGTQLLAFAKADMIGKPSQVAVRQGSNQKVVYFNREVLTPNGPMVENDIATAQVKVVLEDIPATPSFRAQQAQALATIIQAAPPQYQPVLYLAYLEQTDIPNRHDVIDQLRKVAGLPGKLTPEQEQIEAQKAQQAEMIQQQMIALEMQLKQAIINKTQAEAQKAATPPAEPDGDESQYQMVKLQAMEQELKSLQSVQQLQQQIGALKLQLADKSTENQLKSRELDIKEEAVQVDAHIKAEQIVLGHIAANKPAPQPKQRVKA